MMTVADGVAGDGPVDETDPSWGTADEVAAVVAEAPRRQRRSFRSRFRLTPREDSYFDLFAALAQHLVTGANMLAEMLGADQSTRKAIGKQLAEAEHDADEATHKIMRLLNQTFVTPFDRDDIYALASALDDCMDYMEEAGDLIVLYRVGTLPLRVADQVQALQLAAELTADAMPKLRSMESLSDYWVEINRLENQADKAHRKLLAKMFDEVTDPVELMKLKEVVETLEDAVDAFERVANTVETIALKES
jgi:predicted phosphate transport protein (TIGR00153 family)